MKNLSIMTATKGAALCLLGLAGTVWLSGCQCTPPVREIRVEKDTTKYNPCTNSCVRNIQAREVIRNTSLAPVAEPPTSVMFTKLVRHCPPPLHPPIQSVCTSTLQEYPDGIRHLSGGPLYYESQNLNWEQSPPFGRW